jgi:signal transduction histidine kinase
LYWVIVAMGQGFVVWDLRTDRMIALFDLVISGCISGAVILLGQAITEYEIFTGKSLPRRGLSQLWRRTLILAAGYSLLMGWSLVIQLRPVYSLLLGTLILAAFLAMLGWRQYAERERLMSHLRPLLTRQRLYDRSLNPGEAEPFAVQPLFETFCEQVFGVKKAFLLPLGSVAGLVQEPVVHPKQAGPVDLPGWRSTIMDRSWSPGSTGFPCPAAMGQDFCWEIPLWNDRGLAGLLVLGEKKDGGLYTQEEIEVAQAAGEQMLDTMATAELARRLIRLQRQQMAESQVYDRQLRRALHDDFLPRVHEILLAVDSLEVPREAQKEPVLNTLADLHRQISNLLRGLKAHHTPEVQRGGLVEALRRVVEDEQEGAFRQVVWRVSPPVEEQLLLLPPVTAEVVYYAAREAVRNAAVHAGEAAGRLPALTISAACKGNLEIQVEDDGGTLSQAVPGVEKGTGQGLVLHSTMMSIVGGSLHFDRVDGQYTRVILEVPYGTNP